MHVKHRLDKIFGPSGSFAGLILFVAGLIMVYFYWTALFLILLGAFFAFSVTGAEFYTDTRLVRQYRAWFGIFKKGIWIPIDSFSNITIVPTQVTSRAYSLSNRSNYTTNTDFRIVLISKKSDKRLELMKCPSQQVAMEQAEKLEQELDIPLRFQAKY
jgi:hypothetical protein